MYPILAATIAILITVYIMMNIIKTKKKIAIFNNITVIKQSYKN